MDPVFLARLQFAITVSFHFIFPPITIGMAWIMFYMMRKFSKTGDVIYYNMARFWSRIFTATFAVGVATGITMEFQFGTNWASYARFVGDIFGAPLAAEAIFAFFLESTFVAVLIFGWNKLSNRALTVSTFLVALGATISAFWIIVANSWMQTPAGFYISASGRPELANFFDAVMNPSTLPRFLHTMSAAIATGAFFMAGIAAYLILKGRSLEPMRRSLKIALATAFIFALLQLATGHYHAVQVAHTQPEKLATFEGLEITQSEAPAIIFGIPDEATRTVKHAIKIPKALSLLTFGKSEAVVAGMDAFDSSELPPFALTFYTFHLMVMLGGFFIALPVAGFVIFKMKHEKLKRLYLAALVAAIPLPVITNILGWTTAEVGRQPWAVYRVLKTADAASAVVAGPHILATTIAFSAIYAVVLCVWIFIVRHVALKNSEVTK